MLCCACGVLGHLAPVHLCARSVGCVACALSWATWLLFTGVPAPLVALLVRCPGPHGSCSPPVPARCVVLGVRCPGRLGSCSPVCPLGALLCWCGVLGHLAPVDRCVRSVCFVVCAVSWATWLLFTGVPALCVVLHVRCPGPLGSCSPTSPLSVLCCVYRVLGPLPPVHRCARSVCSVGCAVSWATWPVFTSVLARCVVLWVACAGRRCGAHTPPSVACRGWVPSGRALVHPNGGCFVAGRGWVRCRARTRPSGRRLFAAGRGRLPSGRALVHPEGGWCCLAPVLVPWFVACCARSPGLRYPADAVAWHLSVSLGCCRRRAFLACLVAPRGAPRLVRFGRSRCSGRLSGHPGAVPHPRGLAPPALLGGCAGHTEAGGEPGSLCLPLATAEAGALGSLRVVPVRGPAMRLSLASPSGVGLGLRALQWLACVDPVTHASGFPYRPSFDGGLGLCIGAVSCGRRHLPLRVRGRHARVPCVFACACPSWPDWAGRPPGRVLVRLTISFGRVIFLLCSAPTAHGLPLSCSFICFFFFVVPPARLRCPLLCPFSSPRRLGPRHFVLLSSSPPVLFFFLFLFRFAPRLSLGFSRFWPRVPWALALCVVCFVGLRFSALRALSPLLVFFCLAVGCSLVVAAPLPPPLLCLAVFVAAARCPVFFPLLCSCLLAWRSSAVFAVCCPPPSLFLFVLRVSRNSALRVLLLLLFFPPGRWLLPFGCCPSLPSVSRGFRRYRWVLWFFFFFFCSAALLLPPCLVRVGGSRRLVPPTPLSSCLFCWSPPARLSVCSRCFCVSHLAVGWSLVVAAPPPPSCVTRFSSLPLGAPFFGFFSFSLLLCSCPPAWRPSAVLAVCCPPGACVVPCAVWCCAAALPFRRVFCGDVLPLFRAASRAVVPRLAALSAAARRAMFVGASVRVLCCAVGCCCVLCRVSRRAVRLGCSRCGLLSGFGLRCRVPCCAVCPWVRCCAALLRVVPPGAVLLCAVLFCCARLVPLLVVPCPLSLPVALRPSASRHCVLQCCCCWRLVLCCAVFFRVLWCDAGSGGPWLSAGGVFGCRCPCLAAWSASLWLVRFAVVPCFPVACSVVLCCHVVLCCRALLSFCGDMLCCDVLLVVCAVVCPVVALLCCGALSLLGGSKTTEKVGKRQVSESIK